MVKGLKDYMLQEELKCSKRTKGLYASKGIKMGYKGLKNYMLQEELQYGKRTICLKRN